MPNSKLEWAQGQDVTYAVAVPLRAGDYRLAVAVRDEVGGSRSVALLPFTVKR